MMGMQYRTRMFNGDEWGDWKWLPSELIFSDGYHPYYFQFRWHSIAELPFFRSPIDSN